MWWMKQRSNGDVVSVQFKESNRSGAFDCIRPADETVKKIRRNSDAVLPANKMVDFVETTAAVCVKWFRLGTTSHAEPTAPKRHHFLPAGTTTVKFGDLPAGISHYGSPAPPQFRKFCFATVVTGIGTFRRYRSADFMFLPNFCHQLADRIAGDRHG